MPEMDGYETTRTIRQLEAGTSPLAAGHPDASASGLECRASRLPIIAMTANSMQGDRARCLEAGMDDYISKPVQPEDLAGKINRWLREPGPDPPPTDRAAGETPVIAEPETETQAVFQRAELLDRLMGDFELAHVIIEGFLGDIPGQIAKLKGFVQSGDREAATRQAHTIKGASANIGAAALRQAACERHVAINGREALEAFKSARSKRRPYDLICLDIMMPEMDGQTVLREDTRDRGWRGDPSGPGGEGPTTTALKDGKVVTQAFRDGGATVTWSSPSKRPNC